MNMYVNWRRLMERAHDNTAEFFYRLTGHKVTRGYVRRLGLSAGDLVSVKEWGADEEVGCYRALCGRRVDVEYPSQTERRAKVASHRLVDLEVFRHHTIAMRGFPNQVFGSIVDVDD